MKITEPSTMLTDYALAAFTLWLAVRLYRVGQREQTSLWLWIAAFVFTAAASIFGGSYHGFALHLGDFAKTILWKVTVYSVGLMSLFLLSAVIVASVRRPLRRWLLAAAVLKFLAYAVWMTTHSEFHYVIYDYVPSMCAVLVLQAWAAFQRREPSAIWIIAGVLVSFAGAAVQQSGFKVHEHLNHNDLYHLIQMGAVWLFFQGGRRLRDR